MSEWQTEAEFRENLNTPFRVVVDQEMPKPIDLTLVEVESRPSQADEEAGMERFSVFFLSAPEFLLSQGVFHLSHPRMGEFDLFLVPVGQEANGFRYEAVYNFYKPEQKSDQAGG